MRHPLEQHNTNPTPLLRIVQRLIRWILDQLLRRPTLHEVHNDRWWAAIVECDIPLDNLLNVQSIHQHTSDLDHVLGLTRQLQQSSRLRHRLVQRRHPGSRLIHASHPTGRLQDRNLQRHLSRPLAKSCTENIASRTRSNVFYNFVAMDLLVHPDSRIPLVEAWQASLRQWRRRRGRERDYGRGTRTFNGRWGRSWTCDRGKMRDLRSGR